MVDSTTPSPPPKRRRAASRPAGPPPEVEAVTAPIPAAESAPEKKPARKRSSPRAKVEAATPSVVAESGEAPAVAATAKRVARRRKAQSPADSEAASTSLTPAAIEPEAGETAKPVKRTRTRSVKTGTPAAATKGAEESGGGAGDAPTTTPVSSAVPLFQPPDPAAAAPRRRRTTAKKAVVDPVEDNEPAANSAAGDDSDSGTDSEQSAAADDPANRRRRRRGGRGRGRSAGAQDSEASNVGDDTSADEQATTAKGEQQAEADSADDVDDDSADDGSGEESTSARRRRRRRRKGQDASGEPDDPEHTVVRVREGRTRSPEATSGKGSTRLEAKRQRRRDGRDAGRRRAPILSEAEFLARRESVDRVMVVRQVGDRVQIAVVEDGVLVEHYVDQGTSSSMVGNVYVGRVQNVLPSMEAAFVDIGRGRNAVLYAGEVNWDAAGLEGQPRRIELALKSGDPILVQVTKDPVGQKGARLTSQISLPGRYLVYVPDGSMTGISRKLPDRERTRLKSILKRVVPEDAGVIVRTAAEGASEEEIIRDIERLKLQWVDIEAKQKTVSPPGVVSAEPDLAIKVIRDIFNEDFSRMVISGSELRASVDEYVAAVAPDLAPRIESWTSAQDLFTEYRIDEQLTKALDRKVWLPSGGSLVIDRTEAMTVVDVNTGRFTGQGGNLEQTVTENNIEAAEEIVRQLRLRDIGGIIVVDFIDMVLENNRDLVLRRLVECLGRDRTKHQVAEVTSLGLVQMTRKRIGQGLLEAFSTTCESCGGRGAHVSLTPVTAVSASSADADGSDETPKSRGKSSGRGSTKPKAEKVPAVATAGRRKGKGVDPADVIASAATSTEPPVDAGAEQTDAST